MEDKWKEFAIADIAEVVGGGTPSTKDHSNFGGSIPWLTPKDLSGYPYRYISHGERNITDKGLASSSARLLPANSVLLTTRAPVGYVAIAKNSATTNQGFRSLVLRNGFDSEFVYYLLKANTEYLKNHASGTTFGELSGSTLGSLRFLFPPFLEQKAIASILGSLDDKIELNRKMNETLEAMARAIFKSWFVDFDPIHGLGPHTEWQDSPLGRIPKGWRVSSIGDEVKVLGGSTPSTKESTFWEDGTFCWATPKDLSSLASPVLLETERLITEKGLQQISSGLLPKGTVLLSSRAPIGYLAISEVSVAINQGFIAMICDQELPNHYVLHWAKENMDSIEGRANGTTFLEVSKRNFRPIPIIVPPSHVLQVFNQQAEGLYQRIVNNLKESRTLSAIRDTLLPRLLSGEIRVKVAERFVEGVA